MAAILCEFRDRNFNRPPETMGRGAAAVKATHPLAPAAQLCENPIDPRAFRHDT